MKTPLLTALLVALAAAPAAALETCEMPPAAQRADLLPALAGDWTVQNGAGLVKLGPMKIEIDAGKPDTARIRAEGGRVTVAGGDLGAVELAVETGKAWDFALPGESRLDGAAYLARTFGTDPGCAVDALPRLKARGSYDADEGRIDYDLRLFAVSDDRLLGAFMMEMKQGPLTAKGRRVVAFQR